MSLPIICKSFPHSPLLPGRAVCGGLLLQRLWNKFPHAATFSQPQTNSKYSRYTVFSANVALEMRPWRQKVGNEALNYTPCHIHGRHSAIRIRDSGSRRATGHTADNNNNGFTYEIFSIAQGVFSAVFSYLFRRSLSRYKICKASRKKLCI